MYGLRVIHIHITKHSRISSDKMKHFLTYDFTPDPFQKRENRPAFFISVGVLLGNKDNKNVLLCWKVFCASSFIIGLKTTVKSVFLQESPYLINIYSLIWFFQNTIPLKFSGIVESEISFCIFFILSVYFENTREVFKCLWRMRWKYLSIFGEYAESVKAYMEKTANLGFFVEHKTVSANAENI